MGKMLEITDKGFKGTMSTGLNTILETTEESVSELEYKSVEMIQSEDRGKNYNKKCTVSLYYDKYEIIGKWSFRKKREGVKSRKYLEKIFTNGVTSKKPS